MFSGRARDYSQARQPVSAMLSNKDKQDSAIPLVCNLAPRPAPFRDMHSKTAAAPRALLPGALHPEESKPISRVTLSGRKSSDHSTVNTESVNRSSLDQAITAPPFPKGLAIHRAGVITIYPYDAKSLLVVQNTAMNNNGSTVQATLAPMLTIDGGPVPAGIQVLAASAIPRNSQSDSGLLLTPALAVTPPTPKSDTSTLASRMTLSRSGPPAGEPTVFDRARRYSREIVAPFVGQSQGKPFTVHKPSTPAFEAGFQHSNLHPSWPSRSFWNDLSDDDNDEHDYRTVFDMPEGRNPYPVLDKRVSAAQTWRWSDGVWRGKGGSLRGFLIGNTLGLERGPTNKRPHVVNPAMVENRSKVQQKDGQGIMQGMRTRLRRKPAVQDEKFERAWRRRMHI